MLWCKSKERRNNQENRTFGQHRWIIVLVVAQNSTWSGQHIGWLLRSRCLEMIHWLVRLLDLNSRWIYSYSPFECSIYLQVFFFTLAKWKRRVTGYVFFFSSSSILFNWFRYEFNSLSSLSKLQATYWWSHVVL